MPTGALRQVDHPSRSGARLLHRRIVTAGAVSLAAYMVITLFGPTAILEYSGEMIEASRLMDRAVSAIGDYRTDRAMVIDAEIDPNRTGLIGPEISGLMTSVGDAEAKRMTTNPDMAALVVYLLDRAGVDSRVGGGCYRSRRCREAGAGEITA